MIKNIPAVVIIKEDEISWYTKCLGSAEFGCEAKHIMAKHYGIPENYTDPNAKVTWYTYDAPEGMWCNDCYKKAN